MKRLILLLVAFNVACGGGMDLTSPDTVQPATRNETLAVEETAKASTIAGQNVEGFVTDEVYKLKCDDGTDCEAFAWYVGQIGRGARGRAYFNRRMVNRSDVDDTAIRWAAAHEVCHSLTGFGHDDRHTFCTQLVYGGQKPTSTNRIEGMY